jgi:hypothetical protein
MITLQEGALAVSALTVASTAVNVFVGLRLAAMQSKFRADSAALEVSMLKQFVTWKDEVLTAINGKYVSDKLVGEIRMSLGREMGMITARMDHLEKRCDDRPRDCLSLRCLSRPPSE